MRRFTGALISIVTFAASSAWAGSIVEKQGPYEINWSSGKIRFYGVGKYKEGEQNMRATEQRAWADGLKLAETNIPNLMASRLGLQGRNAPSQLSKLAQSTTSVSTTYFGDQRVKVILETPISRVLPQLLGDANFTPPSAEPVGVLLKVTGPAKPSASIQVVDEKGRELSRVPAPRWFKGAAAASETGVAADLPVISCTMISPGVLKLSSADWRGGYDSGLSSGKAAILIQ